MAIVATIFMHVVVLAHSSLPFLAQQSPGPGPTTRSAVPPPWYVQVFSGPTGLLIIFAVMMYVMLFRSKRRQDQERRSLLESIKRGDRVQTIGGILGKVVDVDEAKVLLKVDESSNTKIWFARRAIDRVFQEERGKADAK